MGEVTAIRQADKAPPSEQMRAEAAALRPMSVECSEGYYLSMFGTVAAARQAPMLAGRGLPGDPGCNKVSCTFRLPDGRRVSVGRSRGTDKVWVQVRESVEEERAKRTALDAEWEAECAAKQAKDKADDDADRERARTPDSYRSGLTLYLNTFENLLYREEPYEKYSQRWRMPAGVRAEIDEHLRQLLQLIATVPLTPAAQDGRPALALVRAPTRLVAAS